MASQRRYKWTAIAAFMVAVAFPFYALSDGSPASPLSPDSIPSVNETVTSHQYDGHHVQLKDGSYADIVSEVTTVTITMK